MHTKEYPITHRGKDLGTLEVEQFDSLEEVVSFLGTDQALKFINRSHRASEREKYVNSRTRLDYKDMLSKLKDNPALAKEVATQLGMKVADFDTTIDSENETNAEELKELTLAEPIDYIGS